MQKTTNYNLNKPDVHDPLRVEDFNENADKIDAALGNLNTAMGQIAVPKIAVGTYTGNSSTSTPTDVEVGFTPKCVLVWRNFTEGSNYYSTNYTGVAVQGTALGNDMMVLSETGFSVVQQNDRNGYPVYPQLNLATTYFYFAIG